MKFSYRAPVYGGHTSSSRTSDDDRRALQRCQRNVAVVGIEQTVDLRSARAHGGGHASLRPGASIAAWLLILECF
jgi:hypothetical protein